MRRFDIYTFLSFILQSLPLALAILWVFVFQGDLTKPLPLINCKISEIPKGTGMLLGGFLTLCLLLLGIFIDNLRHLVEWMCEWPFNEENHKENEDANKVILTTKCAFYSRFQIEDIEKVSNNNPLIESIFVRKLDTIALR
ncbi:MAG: hypothetical protein NUV74_12760 [Candidatus Brocadiaceae bacterium]|nr:hypothetical protein [Candidatus Brocadiaceae bacterium]